MKAYIGNEDWADEGNVFFYSLETEDTLNLMRDLIKVYVELDLFPEEFKSYWGTNEYFCFTPDDCLRFIGQAQEISDQELEVFNKFGVYGFDIYEVIKDELYECVSPQYDYKLGGYFIQDIDEDSLAKIEPLFIKLFSQEAWNTLKDQLNDQTAY